MSTCNITLTISRQNSTTVSTYQENIPIIRHGWIQRGETGGPDPPPLENHKGIGFLSNTGPDRLKTTKLLASSQFWAIIGTPAIRHLNVVSLAGR